MCKGYAWNMHGVCTAYAWNTNLLCMETNLEIPANRSGGSQGITQWPISITQVSRRVSRTDTEKFESQRLSHNMYGILSIMQLFLVKWSLTCINCDAVFWHAKRHQKPPPGATCSTEPKSSPRPQPQVSRKHYFRTLFRIMGPPSQPACQPVNQPASQPAHPASQPTETPHITRECALYAAFRSAPARMCARRDVSVYGICMNMLGICKDYVWNMHGIGIEYAWNMHEAAWSMEGIMGYAQNMPGICLISWNLLCGK